ncbi:biotin carboxylase N-terminal domain-containing protein [Microbispora sp. CSR-4]|uniref:ATP-binding protein n=1 Tax=Microbispora sp. CSR-4 TaxID=2592813 RepID=UPI0011C79832|nr:biotin carboxylase N-terminal domain-containing protein [Microbispora sp. CSR-4]
MRKVLVANRGEVAVRIIRGCRDAGLDSVAVYAAPDAGAPHVRLAGEAFALGGDTPAASYLDVGKVLDAALKSGADAVHPGWGFLSENAGFAQAVIDAGLTWIGPPPGVIRELGDKVSARRIAARVGAPLAPGTPGPASGAAEVVAFAEEHGLPVAIKAAYGGGGRGLKVAWTMEEIPELYDSAVREAVTAFGRGECFAERYLDRPRHVETQCLADAHGNVVVVSTRDCSLQRRHQKLVEEAPAPFLTPEQSRLLYESSKAILREAGYVGAGTCEFLVARDGLVSFLEVNTRLQVEHPVSEEVTGLDLVREMFRVAAGEPLGYGDPEIHGHSIEFRINGEDPGRNFLPSPGTVIRWRPPGGPGVRLDSGVVEGTQVGQAFDSLLAKLVVTGRDREQALARARRALAEFEVEGLATTLPFHRALVDDPAFAPGLTVHTQWIETEFAGGVEPYGGLVVEPEPGAGTETLVVEVDGRRVEVVMPAGLTTPAAERVAAGPRRRGARRAGAGGGAPAAEGAVVSPMQGTIVKINKADGETVEEGELLFVLEAMKMEQPLFAQRAGRVAGLAVTVGQAVAGGEVLCVLGT